LLLRQASTGRVSWKSPLAFCVLKLTLRQGWRTHLGCRKGHPSPPGSCTAKAAGRCREGSPGIGCTRRSIAPANPLCIWKKKKKTPKQQQSLIRFWLLAVGNPIAASANTLMPGIKCPESLQRSLM